MTNLGLIHLKVGGIRNAEDVDQSDPITKTSHVRSLSSCGTAVLHECVHALVNLIVCADAPIE